MREDLLRSAMAWMDDLWDDDDALLWTVRRDAHMTRDTAWYALGLLQRGRRDDPVRAARALDAVLAQQYDSPGTAYDGTFRRAPEEREPGDDAVMWIHFDPNWRQFIGTTFAVICDRYADDLPVALTERLRRSIERAVSTEHPDRISPTYSNIALMKAWLDVWSGRTQQGENLASRTYEHFAEHDAFLEFNSPTYYGIDLWALALWRTSTGTLRTLGELMEASLWRDVARFYHADLRNVCGPYDRSYGMDMTTHATPLGLWMWAEIGPHRRPFPDPAHRFSHAHDFCFAPCVVAMRSPVPPDAQPDLMTFRGERLVERTITGQPQRVATAWLRDDAMLGGQAGPPSGIGWFQHHHATAHWRRPGGGIGWARLSPTSPADARAEAGALHVTALTETPLTFEVHPPPEVDRHGWTVEGVRIGVEGAPAPASGPAGQVSYQAEHAPTTVTLRI